MKLQEQLKMKGFRNERQRLMLNIVYTAYWITEQINARLKPYDLSEQQYNVLRILRGQKGKALNLFDIQERMLQRSSNATRLVEKLRLKGLVSREQCAENRRKVEICITPKGLDLLDELEPMVNELDQLICARISEEQAEQMADRLDEMRG